MYTELIGRRALVRDEDQELFAEFASWWERLNLPLRHFQATEMWQTGVAHETPDHAAFGLWQPPTRDLWLNIVPTVLIADVIRHRYGAPLRVISAYRPPVHNAAIGGADDSQHLEFKALDLHPLGGQGASKLFHIAQEVRDQGPLEWRKGGLGRYTWGIHIDSRDTGPAQWRG